MRPPCAYRYALKRSPAPSVFSRNGSRRFLHGSKKGHDVGIIGGGITGLVAAYQLSRDPECGKVTIYEKGPRLGGWIQSERIAVDGGDVVFEYGPRTLRLAPPSSDALMDLVANLRLNDQVLLTPKSSPASQNRYIYYPDHLVRIPTPQKGVDPISQVATALSTLLREPLFETALWSIITEAWKPSLENPPKDESVYDYISRRLSPQMADNIVSSVFHGIFAGDIERLSAQTLLGQFRTTEFQGGTIMGSVWDRMTSVERRFLLEDLLAMEAIVQTASEAQKNYIRSRGKDSSTLTFKNGVGQLTDSLVAALGQSDKVEILTNAAISEISRCPKTADMLVDFMPQGSGHECRTHNHLIATISPSDLHDKLRNPVSSENSRQTLSLACSAHNYATTTMVVNLYYPNPKLLPVRGFGYLIPKTIPFNQNPEMALGVIFASGSSVGQDTAPGTKLTVMLGGHYWDHAQESDYPDEDTAIAMAQSLLKRHLGITDSPTLARARLQRNAIPQPVVGHMRNLLSISDGFKKQYKGRITLAGAWYSYRGTGVVDCIRQAYLAARFYAKGKRPPAEAAVFTTLDFKGGVTGSPPLVAHYDPDDVTNTYF